jgi:hypothetical protein
LFLRLSYLSEGGQHAPRGAGDPGGDQHFFHAALLLHPLYPTPAGPEGRREPGLFETRDFGSLFRRPCVPLWRQVLRFRDVFFRALRRPRCRR